jgi:hypothetical protein
LFRKKFEMCAMENSSTHWTPFASWSTFAGRIYFYLLNLISIFFFFFLYEIFLSSFFVFLILISVVLVFIVYLLHAFI